MQRFRGPPPGAHHSSAFLDEQEWFREPDFVERFKVFTFWKGFVRIQLILVITGLRPASLHPAQAVYDRRFQLVPGLLQELLPLVRG
jgi:hypothetical protein